MHHIHNIHILNLYIYLFMTSFVFMFNIHISILYNKCNYITLNTKVFLQINK